MSAQFNMIPTNTPISTEPPTLWAQLEQYAELGWLRWLDLEFARWLGAEQPDLPQSVGLAAVLLSHQLGRGHICLDLAKLLQHPERLLALPPSERRSEFQPSQWLAGIQLESWRTQLLGSNVVSADADEQTPLVLDGNLLYLRRFYRFETQVANNLLARQAQRFELPDDLAQRLATLFDPLKDPAELAAEQVHWQSVAAALAANSGLTVISGGPGTGKTTTVVRVLALLQQLKQQQQRSTGQETKGLRIRLAAPTGKAAARLSESLSLILNRAKAGLVAEIPAEVAEVIPDQVSTLHRLLGARPESRFFRHHADNPLHLDLLVVDEASMIDLEMMASLLAALPVQARLILLGDKDQLASVDAGSVLGDLCKFAELGRYQADTHGFVYRTTGYMLDHYQGAGSALEQQIVMLRKSHRFGTDSGIGTLARAINMGNHAELSSIWPQFGDITQLCPLERHDQNISQLILKGEAAGLAGEPKGYCHYLEQIQAGLDQQGCCPDSEQWVHGILQAFGEFQLLCAVREGDWGVTGLNELCTDVLAQAGLIAPETPWYAGRPVMMSRNDYSLGLMNGDVGLCLPFAEQGQPVLKVAFPLPDGSIKRVLPSRLNEVETVYAMTVHKAQGSEFNHTVMVLPTEPSPVLTKELIYTGITRARQYFTLLTPRAELLQQGIQSRVERASGLAERLQIK